MSTKSRRRMAAAALSAAVLAGTQPARALNRGQQWFVDNGLQLMGLIGDPAQGVSFHLSTYQSMGYTTQLWEWNSDPNQLTTSWGRWVLNESLMPPQGAESSHMGTLKHLGLGDEEDLNSQSIRDQWVAWYNAAHANPTYNGVLLWNNNWGGQINDAALGDFISRAQPDMISFDTYPYAPGAQPTGGSPTGWYSNFRQYRQWGMDTSTPVGFYRQTYTAPSGSPPTRAISASELSLQTFTGLAFNAKSMQDFTYNFAGTTLFSGGSGDVTLTALGTAAQTINAEAKRLGPALVKLKPVADQTTPAYTSSMMFIRGKNTNGSTYNALPIGFVVDPQSSAYSDWVQGRYDPYMLAPTTAANLGTTNNSLPGDVLVSWFNVMDETMDGSWANEKYFMVTNGLADMNATEAQTRQSVNLDFNFGASGITQLQRLSRSTGLVEDVNLTSLGGTSYRLSLTLDGGRGDLFKFKDGAPFVGIQSATDTLYWDNDGVAAGNNLSTGAGLGGSGTWNTSAKWYNGFSDTAWPTGSNAVFWGTAGTVTLGAAQSAKNLTFKTNGYTVTGSTLTLVGDPIFSTITVDSGVTATIGSIVAGTAALIKAGGGTLNFTTANTYSGGTTITGGVLGIVSGSLGTIPGSPTLNIWIEQGATLRFNINNLTLPTQRLITLGAGGGKFDTNGNSSTIAGVISGSSLTKVGAGTLVLTGANNYTGPTTVSAGTLQIGNASTTGSILGDVTDNAAIQFKRSDALTYAGVVSGTGSLTQAGSGNLTLTGTHTYTGGTTVSAGTMTIPSGGIQGFGSVSLPTGGTLVRSGGIFNFNTLNQTGGTFSHTVSNHLLIAASSGATYTLSSGSLTTNSSYGLWIGATGTYTSGNGTITQSGGTITTNRLELGHTAGMTGTVNLSGSGQIDASDVYVGGTNSAGAGVGVMNITGGTMTLSGWLRIWNTGAAAPGGTRVNFSAGTVSVFGLNTSGNPARWNWTGGTFNLGAGGWLQSLPSGGTTTSNRFTIGHDGPMGASLDLWAGKNFVLNQTPLEIDRDGSLIVSGGTLTANAGMLNNGTFTHTAGASRLGSVTGTGTMKVRGGSITADSINQQMLDISGDATVRLDPGAARPSKLHDLHIADGSKLDLGNSALIVGSAASDNIESLVARGRLVTSNRGAVGVAKAADVTPQAWQVIVPSATLILPTFGGDANLDGRLNIDDYVRIDRGIAAGLSGWSNGDFNYDGKITLADYTGVIDANMAEHPSPLSLTSITAVPEPSTAIGCVMGVLSVAGRRRRTT